MLIYWQRFFNSQERIDKKAGIPSLAKYGDSKIVHGTACMCGYNAHALFMPWESSSERAKLTENSWLENTWGLSSALSAKNSATLLSCLARMLELRDYY